MEEIVPHEQALELKELGFDESTYTWRQNKNGISRNVAGKRDYYNSKGAMYTALPLYQQSFRWIRKNFKYSFYIKKAKKKILTDFTLKNLMTSFTTLKFIFLMRRQSLKD